MNFQNFLLIAKVIDSIPRFKVLNILDKLLTMANFKRSFDENLSEGQEETNEEGEEDNEDEFFEDDEMVDVEGREEEERLNEVSCII